MKSLVLAEKPSVAREMARVMNCHKKEKGYFEGAQLIVTWALGHLATLAEPAAYDPKYKEWNLKDLPMLPDRMKLQVIGETSHQFRIITNLMKRSDVGDCIIATDAGREGELVARWILKLGGWKKDIKRLWISSQTDEAIRQGFARIKPGQEYYSLYQAAQCRAEADWLIGLNVTRALTCKFNAQLSAGRVQTPTLYMILEREKEIENFTPRDFWTVEADFGDYTGRWRDKNGGYRLFEQEKAQEVVDKCKNGIAIVMHVNLEEKSDPPPTAYDLTELQRDANRRYGFSAQKTLSITQDLYEQHKLLTYPRTDSRYITTDMVPTLPDRLKAISSGPYAPLAKPLLEATLNPGKRFVNNEKVSDHHAIIPTEQPLDLSKLDPDEKKILDLVARRFLTVLYPPFRYDQTTLVTMINGEKFYSRGKIIKDQGWRKITTIHEQDEEKKEDKLPDQEVSKQRKGAKKTVTGCRLIKDKTQPPSHYNEATLLTDMENPGRFIQDEKLREAVKDSGLGTPATRAEIIEKLINVNYVERQGKDLRPTAKGRQLIELAPETLRSPALTAEWELRLARIAKGKEDNRQFLADIRENATRLVQSVKADESTFVHENLTKKKCPMCNQFMLIINVKNGREYVCSDFKCNHREAENQEQGFDFRKNRHEERVGKKMIERFSDNKKKPMGSSIGDLFEAALKK